MRQTHLTVVRQTTLTVIRQTHLTVCKTNKFNSCVIDNFNSCETDNLNRNETDNFNSCETDSCNSDETDNFNSGKSSTKKKIQDLEDLNNLSRLPWSSIQTSTRNCLLVKLIQMIMSETAVTKNRMFLMFWFQWSSTVILLSNVKKVWQICEGLSYHQQLVLGDDTS